MFSKKRNWEGCKMIFKNWTTELNKKNILRDSLITMLLLGIATLSSFALFYAFNYYGPNIALIYILALIIIGRYTNSYVPGIIASVIGVICVNIFLHTLISP